MTFTDSQLWSLVGLPLLIFAARILDVALGTIRIVSVSKGYRSLAPVLGFFEILVWLVAIGQVVQNLDRPSHYLAYAAGFAAGTWIGLVVEDRMALGLVAVRIITSDDATDLVSRLRDSDFGVTSFAAKGVRGHVRFLLTIIRKRDFRTLMKIIELIHPDAFVSISDVRLARQGHFSRREPSLLTRLEELRKK